MLAFFTWWLTIQIFGLAALPLARRVFAWLPDRGYAFSKAVGLLLVSYLLWLGASASVLRNDSGGILLALLIVAALSAWLAKDGTAPVRERVRTWWQAERTSILTVETLFLLAFAGWALLRAYAPDKILPAGGEKYMEIAFLNGVLNSPHFPPLDPWLSGYGISYYYFGYVMMAVMTRVSGVLPTVGFDLYDALLFALSAVAAWGVVANLVRAAGGAGRTANAFGLLGALFVALMGNLEGLLEGLYSSGALPQSFWNWIDIPDLAGSAQNGSFYPGGGWWWWRGSRVLHDLDLSYQPLVNQPIDEFPFFSFLLGDNHPHKLALPFVLLAIGLALNLLLKAAQSQPGAQTWPAWGAAGRAWVAAAWARRADGGLLLFCGVTLGGLAFLNTWDFPVYLALIVLADALGRWRAPAFSLQKLLLRSLGLGAGLGILSILLYIFFYLGFSSQAGGVLPYIFPPTRLPQYLVMFGPFVFFLAIFAALAARRAGSVAWPALRAWGWLAGILVGAFLLALLAAAVALSFSPLKNDPTLQAWLGGLAPAQAIPSILATKAANPWLFLALTAIMALASAALLHRPAEALAENADSEKPAIEPATAFALLLAFAGLALTLAVEFFYLRDNFGVRMNTIFKFYFQGWVMMACASAYGAWWVGRRLGSAPGRALFSAAGALLVASGLVYPLMGIASRAGGFTGAPTLDAAASFSGVYAGHWAAQPDDWAAAQWLTHNGRLADGAAPIILEAGAKGYENAGRISAFTGYPTLLGWENHEGQWRGTQEQINERAPVIAAIYTTPSAEVALDLLHRWNVRYVVLGEAERLYISRTCQASGTVCNPTKAEAKFETALKAVFQQGGTTVYQVPYN